jgi:hypothetical protein
MQIEATQVLEGRNVAGSPQTPAAVARLLRRAPFEEPRVVSFDIDFLSPKGPIAYAGNDAL